MERSPPKSLSASDPNLNAAGSASSTPSLNVTVRGNSKRVRVDDNVVTDKFEQFKVDITEMFTSMLTPLIKRLDSVEKSLLNITQQNTDIISSNAEIERTLGFLKNQIIESENKISKLEKAINNTRISIADIEEKSENMERFIRKTSIEIRGVPVVKKESKVDLLQQTSNLFKKIKSESYEIKDVYRLPYKASATTSTLVVEFTNVFAKEEILKRTKQYNSDNKTCRLDSSHLGFADTSSPLYFSEHLTNKSRRLLFLARDFAATENYRFCWIANGRIFLRQKEGEKYIVVKNENTLLQLRSV